MACVRVRGWNAYETHVCYFKGLRSQAPALRMVHGNARHPPVGGARQPGTQAARRKDSSPARRLAGLAGLPGTTRTSRQAARQPGRQASQASQASQARKPGQPGQEARRPASQELNCSPTIQLQFNSTIQLHYITFGVELLG